MIMDNNFIDIDISPPSDLKKPRRVLIVSYKDLCTVCIMAEKGLLSYSIGNKTFYTKRDLYNPHTHLGDVVAYEK